MYFQRTHTALHAILLIIHVNNVIYGKVMRSSCFKPVCLHECVDVASTNKLKHVPFGELKCIRWCLVTQIVYDLRYVLCKWFVEVHLKLEH